uniref:Hepcidin n=1 Tax=Nemipterus japonicus TaxID=445358 RepID=G0YP09_NEMJA|nr:hepcidin [Nemipterus japonicus]
MKTFSVAVAVAVVLTFICLQESSAVPLTEVTTGLTLVSFHHQLSKFGHNVQTWLQFIHRNKSWRSP